MATDQFHFHMLRFALPQREAITAHLNLKWIAERSSAHECDGGPRQYSHLAKAEESRAAPREFTYRGPGADRKLR